MKTIERIRELPLGRKLTLLLLVPCLVVLLLAGGALLVFQISMFRNDFARDLSSVADIVGANATASIAFDDPKSAAEILDSLKAKEHVVGAVLIRPDGTVFARYGRPIGAPLIEPEKRLTFRSEDALIVQPILLEGKPVATLNVVSDYRSVYASLMKLISWMLLIVVVMGVGVAWFLSTRLQRSISDPILRLSRTAQTIADCQNYSVRATEERTAELGILTRTFNQMLERIQHQDISLTHSQRKLDSLIHAIEGIVWEGNPDTLQFTFVSRQCERILGFTPEQWMAEPDFWHHHLHPDDAAQAVASCRAFIVAGQPYSYEYRMIALDGRTVWIRESGSMLFEQSKVVAVRGIFLDITAEKLAKVELDQLNRRLIETSRLAGMAEIATGILHNVGNVLNSVNVSAEVVTEQVRRSRASNLSRAVEILREHEGHLAEFLTTDQRGKILPEYLFTLSEQLVQEHNEILSELASLSQNIEHIKQVVAMQQSYATLSGVFEQLNPAELVEDALRMNAAALERHKVQVVREFAPDLPRVDVDRHKVLQILINLIRNAKQAMDDTRFASRRLTVRVEPRNDLVLIRIQDNGAGISAENLTRVFQHGFTTKQGGHGFGLHGGANAAKEMGGWLSASSDGLGLGAAFCLAVRVAKRECNVEV